MPLLTPGAGLRSFLAKNRSLLVMDEDRRMVERVQRNLASESYDEGSLSPRHERGLAQFHDLVRTAAERGD